MIFLFQEENYTQLLTTITLTTDSLTDNQDLKDIAESIKVKYMALFERFAKCMDGIYKADNATAYDECPGGHSHWPVYVMRLSIDHLFCIGCTPNAPLFYNFTPNDPLFLLFRSKFSGEFIKFRTNLQIAAKISEKL